MYTVVSDDLVEVEVNFLKKKARGIMSHQDLNTL